VRGRVRDPRRHGVRIADTGVGSDQYGVIENVDVDVDAEVDQSKSWIATAAQGPAGSGVYCVDPTTVVREVRVAGRYKGFPGPGVNLEGANIHDVELLERLHVRDCGRVTGSVAAEGVRLVDVDGVIVRAGQAKDRRGSNGYPAGTKLQGPGLLLSGCTGEVTVDGFDALDNASGQTISITHGGTPPTSLIVHDAPGYEPWAGEGAVAASAWTADGAGRFFKDVAVIFGLAFPAAKLPIVEAVVVGLSGSSIAGRYALNVRELTNVGFTARVWTEGDPGAPAGLKVHWRATPRP
jgi:hypothetical protein